MVTKELVKKIRKYFIYLRFIVSKYINILFILILHFTRFSHGANTVGLDSVANELILSVKIV